MAYNKFRWFTQVKRQRPLSKNAPLLNRIKNGDFEYSPYFSEAEYNRQLAVEEYENVMKYSLIEDILQKQQEASESAKMKRARALKLMEAGVKEENKRLQELKEALNYEFGKDLWKICSEKQRGNGTTEAMYWWYKKEVGVHYTTSEMIQLKTAKKKNK